MLKHSRMMICLGVVSMLVLAAPIALAQPEEENHDHGEVFFDTTVGRAIMPTAGDFVEIDEEDDTGEGGGKALGGAGASGYVDVSESMKAGVLTPFYRFSPAFAMKAHVPLIWKRSYYYWGNTEAKTSGLGDVAVDAEYTRRLSSPGAVLRFTGTVKLPTGDHEKMVDDENGDLRPAPLGSGSTDYFLKGQYAKSTPTKGLVASLLFRSSPTVTSIYDYGNFVETIENTGGSQIAASAFGRTRSSKSIWLHLGFTVFVLGDSQSKSLDNTGGVINESELGGTLVDIFPGISYALGPLNPYLGLRIPFKTSFDDDTRYDKRDTSIIFQFSYSPESLAR